MSEEEREAYYRQRHIDIQNGIVNFKSCSTPTSDSFIWTYRTTSCDVISLITTTVPIRDGLMHDIKIPNRDIKRLKPAPMRQSKKQLLEGTPLEDGFFAHHDEKRKKINERLLSERNRFLGKLQLSRHLRSTAENDAACTIQKIYRGHSIRSNLYEVQQYAMVNKQIRSNIRSYLATKFKINLSLAKYKRNLTRIRNRSAVIIQCAFFVFLSRRCLRRRRRELQLQRARLAATKIQALIRGASARSRVSLLVERIRVVLIMRSVLKLQCAVRALLARRRVRLRKYKLRWLACKIIQSWYRTRYSRKVSSHIKNMLLQKRNDKGATALQGIVRRLLACRRVDRIRLRRLQLVVTKSVTIMQKVIRRFVAAARVRRIRVEVNSSRQQQQKERDEKFQREYAAQQAAEAQQLLESVDIYLQASKDRTAEVVDIYTRIASTAKHGIDERDPISGDSIMHIAAARGNLELLKYCLRWGFDMNVSNSAGLTPLLLAAKNDHIEAMQVLLKPAATLAAEDPDYEEGEPGAEKIIKLTMPVGEEDSGFLLVAAAANCGGSSGSSMLSMLLQMQLDVNAAARGTAMTSLLAACEVGHVDAFKMLVLAGADLNAVDALGQTALHKAATSSFKIVELILGLDPNFSTYMSDETRTITILRVDSAGRDSIVHAALAGQQDIAEMLQRIVKDYKAGLKGMAKDNFKAAMVAAGAGDGDSSSYSIAWSAGDISKVMQLIERSNLACVKRLANWKFDFKTLVELSSGEGTAMAACKSNNTDTIDLIMSFGVDFTAADKQGRTAMHFAAQYKHSPPLLPHLLTHQHAAKCKISDRALLLQDSAGDNAFHVAAKANILLNIDLLAQRVLLEAFSAANKEGLTPLQLACSLNNTAVVRSYLKLGAVPTAVDAHGHDSMWHFFHFHQSLLVTDPKKRPPGSEYHSHSPTATTGAAVAAYNNSNSSTGVKKSSDSEISRLTADIDVVCALLKAGCSLYPPSPERSAEDMKQQLQYQWDAVPSRQSQLGFQPGDIIVQECSITLLRTIVPAFITALDGWRLLLSSFWFDDGTSTVLLSLLKAGIIDLLAKDAANSSSSGSSSSTKGAVDFAVRAVVKSTAATTNAAAASTTTTTTTAAARSFSVANVQASKEDQFPVARLQDLFYMDLTLLGWAIKLSKSRVVRFLVKKGYDSSRPLDAAGNSALHFVAMYGSSEMVDTLLLDKSVRLEQENSSGSTAAMLAAMVGNMGVAHRLFQRRASPRRALDGCYAGWVLAVARRKEAFEKNLQTGRYGDDDETYFSVAPDPLYSTWYQPQR